MSEQRCGALRHGKHECHRPVQKLLAGVLPLCTSHLATIRTEIRSERDKKARKEAAKYIDRRIQLSQIERTASSVYFIQAGRRVKIGQSQDPATRLVSIRGGYSTKKPEGLNTSNAKLIATEPGGLVRERELHQQFAHLRVAGEWFDHTPELKAYIAANATPAAA
jgi:hypothetical protein